jgi:putative spermidine/putrescine transport system substrate-binding protein
MEDSWINSVIFTAIYLKGNSVMPINEPGNLTESELGAVMEFLIKKKREGQFRTFWNGWEDGVRLIKSGEVYAMTGWEPIVYEAQKAGIKAEYAVPREGFEGWSNDLIITPGAKERGLVELVHKFANWELSGFYGAELMMQRGYIVPNPAAVNYANTSHEYDANELQRKLDHVRNKFLGRNTKVFWQNTRPDNYRLYEEWWSKLRNA